MGTAAKRAAGTVGALAAVGAVWGAVTLFAPARTPEIRDPEDGRAVASLERLELGGVDQWILVRGRDRERPVVLFLHGGPGMPLMYLAHEFQRPLEEAFVVVQWDRRGAGKSYDALGDVSELRVSRMLADAEELVAHLRQRFGRERVVVVGHSWGSYLGMLLARRRPEWLHAFVGVGQTTWPGRERALADSFIVAEARRRGRKEALEAMAADPDEARERWLFRFGAELHEATSFLPLIWTGLRSPEYGPGDVRAVARGSSRASARMRHDVLDAALPEAVESLEVPVYFFQGVHDMVTPTALAREYLEGLRAPRKGLVLFQESAHFPFLEEPDRFARELVRIVDELEGGAP